MLIKLIPGSPFGLCAARLLPDEADRAAEADFGTVGDVTRLPFPPVDLTTSIFREVVRLRRGVLDVDADLVSTVGPAFLDRGFVVAGADMVLCFEMDE